MNRKLVIITTAITRGDYHKKSLGYLYESSFFNSMNLSDIYHIINVDHPKKLYDKFSIDETLSLFDEIVPEKVNKIIIKNNSPGFLNAYENVVNKVVELGLNINDNVIWWLEDDWKYIDNGYDPLKICMELCKHKNVAINSVQSSPFGSFRGGPIMSSSYFNNYFNISALGVANKTCDPEKQVGRWLSGINRTNGRKRIHRDITGNDKIDIFYICSSNASLNIKEIPVAYYNNPAKYNKDLKFNYHYLKLDGDNVLYSTVDVKSKQPKLENISQDKLSELLNTDNITHISLKPWSFEDIGRQFNTTNGLNKWSTINDNTTYV